MRKIAEFFEFEKYNTNFKTETIAGFTTFFAMVYIIFANPNILAASGMPQTSAFVATILAAFIGTIIIALYANVPYGQAPGMGINAFFAYTVCLVMGFTWQEALAMVLICGIIGIIITLTGIRKALVTSFPKVLQSAIGGGIGLFIAYIGFKQAGLLQFTGTTEGVTEGVLAMPSLV
ncbi:MAG: solute carrier family 23 protein, partial [Methanobacteriaceae archaeon]